MTYYIPMEDNMTAAVLVPIVSAVIGAGASIYAGEEQKKAQAKAQKSSQEFQEEQAQEAARLADANSKTDAPAIAATVEFGADKRDKIGSSADFLVPRASNKRSGLSTGNNGAGLGFYNG